MRRSQWAALLGVGLLLVVALLVRDDSPAVTAAPAGPAPDLSRLRAAAALAPCPPGLGPELPALTLPCLADGEPVELRAAGPGRPTVLNLWAPWCGPCRDEVPALVRFAERAGDRVGVVGITYDSAESSLTFAEQYGITYPNVLDDQGEVRRQVGAGGLPTTLLLTADGQIAWTHKGALTSAELDRLVAQHLGIRL